MSNHWNYQVYNAFTCVLSTFIIVCIALMQYISHRVSLLPLVFHMISRKKRRMYCYDLDITLGLEGERVRGSCTFLLQTVIVVVSCYLWQTCVLKYRSFNLMYKFTHEWLIDECVLSNNCYGAKVSYSFFLLWANPPNVCSEYSPATISEVERIVADDYKYILCINFLFPDTINYTERFAIAFALSNMIVVFFEILVWLLYRYNNSICNTIVIIIALLFILLWVVCFFVQYFFPFFTCWLGYIMLLAVPIVLLSSRSAAMNLRLIHHKKFSKWKSDAILHLDELKDEKLKLENSNELHEL